MTPSPSPGPSRSRAALPALPALLLAVLLPTTPPAVGEEPPGITLSLMAQTGTLSPGRPFRIVTRATNTTGRPVGDLTLSLWIYHPARSRSTYLQGLEGEPPTAPLHIASLPQRGRVAAGASRLFRVRTPLPQVDQLGESAVFPVKVQLESQGEPVAALRSALVSVAERPLVPLNVSFTFVLDPPFRFRPDGTLLGTELEEAVADQGELDQVVSALEDFPATTTLVVAPLLLSSLADMSDGYRVVEPDGVREVPDEAPPAEAAQRMLARIREVARRPGTELVALPYAAPSIPSLLASGLASDLGPQLRRGHEVTERLLGTPPAASIFHPPGSRLTDEALAPLAAKGVEVLILRAEQIPPPEGLTFSPPATAVVEGELPSVAPDPGIATRLDPQDGPDDPRLRAQQILGEMAAVYFEFPSQVRGLAVVFDRAQPSPPELLRPLMAAVANLPRDAAWMRSRNVSQLISAVPPETPEDRRRLRPSDEERFSSFYVDQIEGAKTAIDQFASMASEAGPLDRFRDLLLVAERRSFLGREGEGLEFVQTVRRSLAREFDKVEAPAESSITLTSRGGVIPVTLESLASYGVTVRVTLLSPRLDFPEGASKQIMLTGRRSITFPARAQTTGRFPVTVTVTTPGGRMIAESQIVVRSTAYNRVALFMAIGAALFLALWWGRRFLRPTRS